MSYIKLPLGAYRGRSIVASAGRNVNLYVEQINQGAAEPYEFILYPTPGLTLLRAQPNPIIRFTYRATTGNLYTCAGQQVFYVNASGISTLLGTITPSAPSDAVPRTTPVSMTDNGSVLLMCDGSVDGYYVDLTQPIASQVLTRIDTNINQGWLGSDRVDYVETFFICNSPGTPNMYCSVSNPNAQSFATEFTAISSVVDAGGTGYVVGDVLTLLGTGGAETTVQTVSGLGVVVTSDVTGNGGVASTPANPVAATGGGGSGASFVVAYTTGYGAFNPLDFAAKTVIADNLVSAVVAQSFIWLLGEYSYGVWYNSGGGGSGALVNNTFPFEISQGIVKNIGCVAPYSIVANDFNTIYWLSQDAAGQGLVMQGTQGVSTRISTHAIETQISSYPTISDCVGYVYQQQGHVMVAFNFPSAPNFNGQADAGVTWVFDAGTNEWHERTWIDSNGIEHRHRANCAANVYGMVVCGDWENANLYRFDLTNFTDNGNPIKRVIVSGQDIDTEANRRILFTQLIANMQVGSDSPNGAGPPIEVVDCTFVNPNGTLLQAYANPNDIGASFTKTGSVNGEIVNDAFTASATGSTQYEPSGQPSAPDYVVSFNVELNNYSAVPINGSVIYAIGRANGSGNGYQAAITSNGTTMSAQLKVMPSGTPKVVSLGTLTSGYYTVSLTMQAEAISVAVQRSEDGTWLTAGATWTGLASTAIAISDATYTAVGTVLAPGGTWV